MKALYRGVLAGLLLFVPLAPATAYQTVSVDGVETARIMVAPARTDLARTIQSDLRVAMTEASAGSRSEADARQLYYFYGARYFEPLWIVETADGIGFSEAAQAILGVFENAHLQGLDPDDYFSERLYASDISDDPDGLATLESAFSAAILRYATDAHTGRLDPRQVSSEIDIARKSVDEAALFAALAETDDPASVLMGFHPAHPEFIALRDLLARHYSGEVEALEPVGDGPLIRAGGRDPRVPLLRERLGVTAADETDETLYDSGLADAVKTFQGEMGLNPDGVVGPATVAALNGMGGASRAEIVANMERWRWLPADLGEFHVFVNVPEYRVEVANGAETVWEGRAIVGTPARQTPIFSDNIRHVVTNPYWNLPPTILREDVMPRVAANPNYIASQNMELLYNGQKIDPWMVDWSLADPNVFRVRQRPGPNNALGRVKFLFPNKHDVYLHDTNAPALFSRSMRALSSGCVRVEDPFAFSEVLLRYETAFTAQAVENSLGPNERWFTMQNRVPVHLAYFTLRVDDAGTVRAFGDVYGHNARVMELLGV